MEKIIVTGMNPKNGSGFKTTKDEKGLKEFSKYAMADYIKEGYIVICTKTSFDDNNEIDYQVVINVHPKSINCDCGKGIYCPFNMQQVNYYKGQVA